MTAPVRGCTGKVAFGTFTKAAHAARNLRRRSDTARVSAYHCQHCNGYHVGEDDTGGRRRKGRARVMRASQAVTLVQFRALFAAALADNDQPQEGPDHAEIRLP